MLLREQRLQRQLLPGFERRELVLQFLVFFVLAVFGLFIDFEEAVELHHRSGDAEPEHVVSGLGVPASPPLACWVLASMSTEVWSNTAGFICEATKRCQISL